MPDACPVVPLLTLIIITRLHAFYYTGTSTSYHREFLNGQLPLISVFRSSVALFRVLFVLTKLTHRALDGA